MRLRVATITLVTVCLLLFTSVSHAIECDTEGFPTSAAVLKQLLKDGTSQDKIHELCSPPTPTAQLQIWHLIVGIACIVLLIPALTAALWDVGYISATEDPLQKT